MGGGGRELTPRRRRAEYDYGERFDLKGPYCDNGYIDEDADFGKQARQPLLPDPTRHAWAAVTKVARSSRSRVGCVPDSFASLYVDASHA